MAHEPRTIRAKDSAFLDSFPSVPLSFELSKVLRSSLSEQSRVVRTIAIFYTGPALRNSELLTSDPLETTLETTPETT